MYEETEALDFMTKNRLKREKRYADGRN